MSEPVIPKPKVFLSYSRKDEVWKERLLGHLQVAAREDGFDLWDDRRIRAGADWRAEILREIGEAGVAVLLISTDFLRTSRQCRALASDLAPALLRGELPDPAPVVERHTREAL